MILGDGSLLLKLYYDIIHYSITYSGNGGTLVGFCGPESYTITSPQITPTCVGERDGYTFS